MPTLQRDKNHLANTTYPPPPRRSAAQRRGARAPVVGESSSLERGPVSSRNAVHGGCREAQARMRAPGRDVPGPDPAVQLMGAGRAAPVEPPALVVAGPPARDVVLRGGGAAEDR